MKITGDIRKITTTRNSKLQDIQLEITSIEYLTHKKDGRYFQAFSYEDELDTPIIITGDQLARKKIKPAEEGEYELHVYDKVAEDYVLNPTIDLEVLVQYDFEEDLLILTSLYYAQTLPPKEFEQLKADREKEKAYRNRIGKKKR